MTICTLFKKLQRTGSFGEELVAKLAEKVKPVITREIFIIISGIVKKNLRNSIRRIATEFGLKH